MFYKYKFFNRKWSLSNLLNSDLEKKKWVYLSNSSTYTFPNSPYTEFKIVMQYGNFIGSSNYLSSEFNCTQPTSFSIGTVLYTPNDYYCGWINVKDRSIIQCFFMNPAVGLKTANINIYGRI